MFILSNAQKLYNTNKIVKFCTNATTIVGFLVLIWQGAAWATSQVDEYFAKTADVRALQNSQIAASTEQKEQRQLLEKQGRQLDFIYYDSMKREKINLEREIFELRSRTRSGVQQAHLEQLLEDLRDLKERIEQQEAIIRGNRPQ